VLGPLLWPLVQDALNWNNLSATFSDRLLLGLLVLLDPWPLARLEPFHLTVLLLRYAKVYSVACDAWARRLPAGRSNGIIVAKELSKSL
jgi:hypothetical protein